MFNSAIVDMCVKCSGGRRERLMGTPGGVKVGKHEMKEVTIKLGLEGCTGLREKSQNFGHIHILYICNLGYPTCKCPLYVWEITIL